jgi:hypothetical protein
MTSATTLSQHEGFLSNLVSGRIASTSDADGYIFVDRDGDLFYYVLEFLRTASFPVNLEDRELLARLLIEADFYQILPLKKVVEEYLYGPPEKIPETEEKVSGSHLHKVLLLNVGGKFYKTTLQTLYGKTQGLFLPQHAYLRDFCEGYTNRRGPPTVLYDEEGRLFIDRNGEYFHYILEFLRTGNRYLNALTQMQLHRINQEALFYLGDPNPLSTSIVEMTSEDTVKYRTKLIEKRELRQYIEKGWEYACTYKTENKDTRVMIRMPLD